MNKKLEDLILLEIKRQILKEEGESDKMENDFESILKSMVGDMKSKTSDLEKLQNDKEQIKMAPKPHRKWKSQKPSVPTLPECMFIFLSVYTIITA